MKRKGLFAFLISLMLLTGIVAEAEITEDRKEAVDSYLTVAPGGDVAYCNFYGDFDSRNMSFIDGLAMGIKDNTDPIWFEEVILDGYEGRKQYSRNTTYMTVDDDFYGPDDHEFIVNILYYDFGPSEGTYYLSHFDREGTNHLKAIVKPGNYPGWTYITWQLSNVDLSKTFDNGANLRLVNGAYNAWRRVEVVNLSKLKREGKTSLEGIHSLGMAKKRDLEKPGILPDNDTILMPENLAKPCTMYDVQRMLNVIRKDDVALKESDKEVTMTQRELLGIFMSEVGMDWETETNIVDFALKKGFVDGDGIFVADDWEATNYNLGTLLHDVLYYEYDDGYPVIWKMYEFGFWGDKEPKDINNAVVKACYYREPKLLPYITITDNLTGRTFKYVNFFGDTMLRTYLGISDFLPDGKRFICGTHGKAGERFIYMYNTETQILTYIGEDKRGGASANGLTAAVGADGMIYFYGLEDGNYCLVRVDPDDPKLEQKIVYRFPGGVSAHDMFVGTDGERTWFTGQVIDGSNYFGQPNHQGGQGWLPLVRFDIPEESKPGVPDETYEVLYTEAIYQGETGQTRHHAANPTNPNIGFFCVEPDTANQTIAFSRDRTNLGYYDTGKIWTYNQGLRWNDTNTESTTHESFSYDGKYLVGMVGGGGNDDNTNGWTGQIQNGVFRVDMEGRHRQTYWSPDYAWSANHAAMSYDNKWVCVDGNLLAILNTDTHQGFEIAAWARNTLNSHPYHMHATFAINHNILSWGHTHKGVVGMAWYDVDAELGHLIAEGGRYNVNEYVDCVSYEDIECESFRVEKDGRDCQMSKAGKAIHYEINPEIVDTTNDAIRITFDYLDNEANPITLTYTGGVTNPNEDRLRFNKKIQVARKGTGEWKTAVIEIEEANCESVAKFEADFAIGGGSANTYISNVKVERMEVK